MFQPDLFMKDTVADELDLAADIATLRVEAVRTAAAIMPSAANDERLDLPAVLERLARISSRPRYTFMVLNLIARAAGRSNSAGPYIRENGRAVPVRDWLSDALLPMAQRDPRRQAVVDHVRRDLEGKAPSHRMISPPSSLSPTRFVSGCCIRAEPMSAARFPISFAPDSSAGTTKATASITATAEPSAKRSIRSRNAPPAR